MKRTCLILFLFLLLAGCGNGGTAPPTPAPTLQGVAIGVDQNAIFYNLHRPAPLVVALHAWSYDYQQPTWYNYHELAVQYGWHMIFPDYPSCSHEQIINAVDYAVTHAEIEKIYITGHSGGGHAALLTASKRPDLFTAVSAWCPITDIEAWYNENPNYQGSIENLCDDYYERSPINFLSPDTGVTYYLNHGASDTVVLPHHSLDAATILGIEANIFTGGHEIDYEQAFEQLTGQ